MTRREHLDWAKARALAYLPGDPAQAFASFTNDLMKFEPRDAGWIEIIKLGMALAQNGHLEFAHQMRDFIEGTN